MAREAKWGVIERFRVRPEWRGRALERAPDFLQSAIDARLELMRRGAHALGPFRTSWPDGEWWAIAWEFPERSWAEALRSLWEDPRWRERVETSAVEGEKHEPRDGLPGF